MAGDRDILHRLDTGQGTGGTTPISTPSTVSTVNSSTANLAANATFTGTSESVANFAAIQVTVFSSHVSATDGLSLQQSSDGTNWDVTDTYSIPATTGKAFSLQPAARFYRLVYTNGATITTSLRIQTVYHTEAPNPSSQRTQDGYTNETDMTQNWVFDSIYNGSTFDRVRSIAGASTTATTGLPATVPIPNALAPTLSVFSSTALTTTIATVKATPGRLYDIHIGNSGNVSMTYLQCFDVASATTVTLGTTAPTFVLTVPASGTLDKSMLFAYPFANGLKVAATTGPTNAIAPANGVNVTIGYA